MTFTKRPLWKYLTNNPDVEYDIVCFNGHKLTFGCGSFELDKENNVILIGSYNCIKCESFGTKQDFMLLQCVEPNPVIIQKLHNKIFTFLCPYKPKYF